MQLITLFSSLLLAASVLPHPVNQQGARFSVKQLSVPRPRYGPRHHQARTHRKYGCHFPGLDNGLATRSPQTASAPVSPLSDDQAYLLPIDIDGTTFNLNLDTGSSDLWVLSTELPAEDQVGHTIYNTNSAPQLDGYSWSIEYADGSSASGDVFLDTVTIGEVSYTGQAIEAASSVSGEFLEANEDGLIGAAFSSLNTVQPVQQKTFMDNLVSSGRISQPVFCALLLHNTEGWYDFGFVDDSKHTVPISYIPVDDSQGYWLVSTEVGVAAVDTGTTLVYLPSGTIAAYYANVADAVYDPNWMTWTFPCSSSLPDFQVEVGGVPTLISGRYLNYAPIDATTCWGGLQSSDYLGVNILGDVWIKNKYIVFDQTPGSPILGIGTIDYLS